MQKYHDAIVPGSATGVQVNGDLSFALRLFKKNMKDSSKLEECYTRKEYTKPSILRRKQLDLAKYKNSKG